MKAKSERVVYVAERDGVPRHASTLRGEMLFVVLKNQGFEIVEYVPRHLRLSVPPQVRSELKKLAAGILKHTSEEAKPKKAQSAKKPRAKGGRRA